MDFPKRMLIDECLLNCNDYNERIKALTKVKNGDGWYHLFDEMLNPNFILSNHYYKDIDMLSKAETAQYVLWVIGKDEFINSPYHDEDLKLIVETKDTAKEKRDPVVWETLATVAKNPNSINSPYHKEDMELIAKSGSNCLKREYGLTELAIDEVSLKDKYHLENMQILAKYPKYGDMLLQLMTNEVIINGKYYREEINALATSKGDSTARALYYYIYNPKLYLQSKKKIYG